MDKGEGGQHPPPPAYQPPPQQGFPQAQPAVVVGVPVVPQGGMMLGLSEFPATVVCPKCQQQVVTNVQYVNGLMTWIIVIVLLFVFFPLMCVPCCIDSCKDVEHYCPNCNNFIGVKKRIN